MAITDPAGIRFSNEYMRRQADLLARSYWRCHQVVDQWGALSGTNAEKLALMGSELQRAAGVVERAFWFGERLRLTWTATNIQSVLPNDAAEEVWDNPGNTGQRAGVPPVTGQDLRRLKWRTEEFTNHLKYSPLGDTLPVFRKDGELTAEILEEDGIKDVIRMAGEGVEATGTWAGQLVTICTAIVTEYETTNPSFLNHVLAVAPNPGQVT